MPFARPVSSGTSQVKTDVTFNALGGFDKQVGDEFNPVKSRVA